MFSHSKFPDTIFIDNKHIALQVRRLLRCKSLRLRYDIGDNKIHLSLPYGVSTRKAMDFLHQHEDWLATQIGERKVIGFYPNAVIPYLGGERILCYDRACKKASMDDECIIIGGDEAEFAKRVERFLKAQVRILLTDLVEEYTNRMGCDYGKIRIGDAKGSWGSCSSLGTLSFGWRLIFLPEALMRYVVVHEVCHLRYMNHSAAFWNLVGSYEADYKNLRKQLRSIGGELRLIGACDG